MSSGPTHNLKTWPVPFQAVWEGIKFHEVRKNDRGFTDRDLLVLEEFDPETQTYSGRELYAAVTYVTPGGSFGLPQDMVVMSIRVIARRTKWSSEMSPR